MSLVLTVDGGVNIFFKFIFEVESCVMIHGCLEILEWQVDIQSLPSGGLRVFWLKFVGCFCRCASYCIVYIRFPTFFTWIPASHALCLQAL